MDNKHVVKVPTLTVEKKPLVLVLPLLDSISLEIMLVFENKIVFENKTRLGNNCNFKDRIAKDLTSGFVYMFPCGLCNDYYGMNIMVKVLDT